jgi:hypothetical protein
VSAVIKTNMIDGWHYGRPLTETYRIILDIVPDRLEAAQTMRWYLFNLRDRMQRKFKVL